MEIDSPEKVPSIFSSKRKEIRKAIHSNQICNREAVKKYVGLKQNWVCQIGTQNWDEVLDMQIDKNGNIYLLGYTLGKMATVYGNADLFLAKYSKKGKNIWFEQFGTDQFDRGWSLIIDDATNQLYLVGTTKGDFEDQKNMGKTDVFIMKYTTSGKQVWIQNFGTSQNEYATGVNIGPNGNIYVIGYMNTNLHTQKKKRESHYFDAFLIKLNPKGQKKWVKQFGTKSEDRPWGIDIDLSGNIYITGSTRGNMSTFPYKRNSKRQDSDVFIAKLHSKGTQIWVRQYGNQEDDAGWSLKVDDFGNTFVTGMLTQNSSKNKNSDILLLKYNTKGILQWDTKTSTKYHDYGNALYLDAANNIYITGHTKGEFQNEKNQGLNDTGDAFMVKFNGKGIQQWITQLGNANFENGMAIAKDQKGHIYITGNTTGELIKNGHAGLWDFFLIKYTESNEDFIIQSPPSIPREQTKENMADMPLPIQLNYQYFSKRKKEKKKKTEIKSLDGLGFKYELKGLKNIEGTMNPKNRVEILTRVEEGNYQLEISLPSK